MGSDLEEKVLRRTKNLDSVIPEEYQKLYRTKDIYLAAFLMARGFQWVALEEVEVQQVVRNRNARTSRPKKLMFFLFDERSQIERLAIQYFNGNRANLNVNANSFVQSYQTVRSIITNPPL